MGECCRGRDAGLRDLGSAGSPAAVSDTVTAGAVDTDEIGDDGSAATAHFGRSTRRHQAGLSHDFAGALAGWPITLASCDRPVMPNLE